MTILFILTTCMFDQAVELSGEIRYYFIYMSKI